MEGPLSLALGQVDDGCILRPRWLETGELLVVVVNAAGSAQGAFSITSPQAHGEERHQPLLTEIEWHDGLTWVDLLPTESLHLTTRPYNGLKRRHIDRVTQILAMTEAELLDARNFGTGCVDEVDAQLAELGLSRESNESKPGRPEVPAPSAPEPGNVKGPDDSQPKSGRYVEPARSTIASAECFRVMALARKLAGEARRQKGNTPFRAKTDAGSVLELRRLRNHQMLVVVRDAAGHKQPELRFRLEAKSYGPLPLLFDLAWDADMSIDGLGLTRRAAAQLRRNRVHTVPQLVTRTNLNLRSVDGACIADIDTRLTTVGVVRTKE